MAFLRNYQEIDRREGYFNSGKFQVVKDSEGYFIVKWDEGRKTYFYTKRRPPFK